MTTWANRSREERSLLNPSFCACLFWHAARGHSSAAGTGLPVEEAFLVLPLVLHRGTRELLPRSARTSLAVWLDRNPLARGRIATRAGLLTPFTREGISFGGLHHFISIEKGALYSEGAWAGSVAQVLRESSDEVRECATRSAFVGNWFAHTGNASTVLALVGVRP